MKLFKSYLFIVSVFLAGILFNQGNWAIAAMGMAIIQTALMWKPAPGLMANTLTNLIPDVYAALDVVSEELIGFIPCVARDSTSDRVALNQTLRSPVSPAASLSDITPAMSIPSAIDNTFTNKTLTISRSKFAGFSWTGEEQYSVNANGPGFLTLRQDQIAQCFRALNNQIETDLAGIALGSRATGTAGTTPFASNINGLATLKKILDDNGAPATDRHFVMNTSAGANMRSVSNLYKVNEAGDGGSLLRTGSLGNIFDFDLRESGQVANPAAGSGTSYVVNGTTAKNATTVTLKTGSGTVLAGDIISISSAGVVTNYVVTTGTAAAGAIVIQAPGLVQAAADGDVVTVLAASVRNVGFTRNSMLLATRLPAIPDGGDLRLDSHVVTSPKSGISYEISLWPGQRMNLVQIALNWGYTQIKTEHMAVLMG